MDAVPVFSNSSNLLFGLFGLAMVVVEGAVLFGIVYAAVRLALRHERRVSDRGPTSR